MMGGQWGWIGRWPTGGDIPGKVRMGEKLDGNMDRLCIFPDYIYS